MEQVVLSTQVQTRFVQLYARGTPYLVSGSEEAHWTILANALDELGIFPKIRFGIPNATGDDYELVGDGFCGKIGNEYKLRGQSAHFKRGPNKKHLEDLASVTPVGVTITIDD